MTPTMNASLMAFGGSEKTFQIEVIDRQIDDIAADEESRGPGAHHLCHLLLGGVPFVLESSSQSEE
jgi:hypothetical protein